MARWRGNLPAFVLGCAVGAGVALAVMVPYLDTRYRAELKRAETEREKVAAKLQMAELKRDLAELKAEAIGKRVEQLEYEKLQYEMWPRAVPMLTYPAPGFPDLRKLKPDD